MPPVGNTQHDATGSDSTPRAYFIAVAACSATTAIATPLIGHLDLANIVMLFLLAVVLIAVRLGKGPAVMAAFLSVAMFDFFFVPPRFSFEVADAQYLLTFAVMLVVALIIGQLAAGLRLQTEEALIRGRRTRALYEMARGVAGALTMEQVAEISCGFLRDVISAKTVLLLPDENEKLLPLGAVQPDEKPWIEQVLAETAYRSGLCADLNAAHPVGYFPLKTPTRIRGVLAIAFDANGTAPLREHRELLETVASLIATAMERLHYVDIANRAQVQMMAERLRSSVLSAVSHDLRTPLTALVGLADSLAIAKPPLSGQHRETAEIIRDQAVRLSGLVVNLLDLARLNAGEVKLRKEWTPLEEDIGSSIKLLEKSLSGHRISVRLPPDLPLLEFDAVLIERVFCNLLENAAKYAPSGSPIVIEARKVDSAVVVAVSDAGPGVPKGQSTGIFDMFVRGARESAKPGVGLGLAICRAIVEAHGGSIKAENCPEGGARFIFTLPAGTPPAVEAERP